MMDNERDVSRAPGGNPDPASPDHAPIVGTTEARGAVTVGSMRWVLGVSLAAVIAVMLIIWALTGG
jgi:hypothetical protein